ncbi:MAG: hypothetical protein ACREJ3_16245, partial [Polyangiaceae bacterium]
MRRFVDRIAFEYGATSALEGPVDGAGAERGTHALLLAKRGINVTVAVSNAAEGNRVRLAYVKAGGTAPEVRVLAGDFAVGSLPAADLVVSFDALSHVSQWESYLSGLARLARKALVVVLRNPERLAWRRSGDAARATHSVAPVLWAAGRVREHAYLIVPEILVRLSG